MRKIIILLSVIMILSSSTIYAKENKRIDSSEVLTIYEESYLTQIEEIYKNADKFKDKLINFQGFMYSCSNENGDFFYVVRKSPGCCGNDGLTGFEIIGDIEYPKDNKWVDVSGKITIDEDENGKYLYIKVYNIEEKDESGLRFVSN